MQDPTPTTHPTGRPRRWIAIPTLAAAAFLLLLTPTLAQENGSDPAEATVNAEGRGPRLERWMALPSRLPGGVRASAMSRAFPDGAVAGQPARVRIAAFGPFGGLRGGGSAADRSGEGAFARWLEAEPRPSSVLPGLVGHLDDGASVRLSFYDGDPADGGELRAELSYVAGQDDLAAFQAAVRAAAGEASHLVVDVTGRTVVLPQVSEAAVEEQVGD